MLGLETALALTLTELVEPGVLSLADALALLSWRPAAIAGLTGQGGPVAPGSPANLVVIDPALRWEVDPARLASRARNTPFVGRKLTGKVRHTVFRGDPVVVIDGPQPLHGAPVSLKQGHGRMNRVLPPSACSYSPMARSSRERRWARPMPP